VADHRILQRDAVGSEDLACGRGDVERAGDLPLLEPLADVRDTVPATNAPTVSRMRRSSTHRWASTFRKSLGRKVEGVAAADIWS
jgi:hypothetical protein